MPRLAAAMHHPIGIDTCASITAHMRVRFSRVATSKCASSKMDGLVACIRLSCRMAHCLVQILTRPKDFAPVARYVNLSRDSRVPLGVARRLRVAPFDHHLGFCASHKASVDATIESASQRSKEERPLLVPRAFSHTNNDLWCYSARLP